MADNARYRDDPEAEESGIGGEEIVLEGKPPANSYFKRTLKILTWAVTIISLLTVVLLITTFILLQVWNFNNNYRQDSTVRDLAIVLSVTALLTIPTLFFQVPILINIVVHLVMCIQDISFAAEFFGWRWPDESMCRHWTGDPGYTLPTNDCLDKLNVVRIMMGVGAGFGILVGALLIIMIFARVIALFRTRFWQTDRVAGWFTWKSFNGFTVQFSLSIIPAGTLPVVVDTQSHRVVGTAETPEQERLVET